MIPVRDAKSLRLSGRNPVLPFRVSFGDGREVVIVRLLRLLPGKRLVGEGVLDGVRVLAKLYLAKNGKRHWLAERSGIERLGMAGMPTPALVAAGECRGGGYVLVTEFLAQAESMAARWQALNAATRHVDACLLMKSVAFLIGRLHAAGLVHDDLHFGNVLVDNGRLYLIDGDAVHSLPADAASRAKLAIDNLALLLGQLPPDWDRFRPELLMAYGAAAGQTDTPPAAIDDAVERVRGRRLADFLGKSVRDCSLFSVQRSSRRFLAVKRAELAALQPLLADPDTFIANGMTLKNGATCTVASVEVAGRRLVVKRYNIKDAGHALSRLFRPSRAWHAWREGHRLQFLGIPTPEPLALIEERLGPLRRRAWLITEYCPGIGLGRHLSAGAVPAASEGGAICALFEALCRFRLSHGDLKAANLLWDGERVQMIDLDAMTQHRTEAAFRRAWRKDRARLLRNWGENTAMHCWLERSLPAA